MSPDKNLEKMNAKSRPEAGKKNCWVILQSHFESVSAAYDTHVTRLDFRGPRAMERELDRLMADAHLEATEGTKEKR